MMGFPEFRSIPDAHYPNGTIFVFTFYSYNYYNDNIKFYFTNSDCSTTLQERCHVERKDNDYPMANKRDTQH